MAETITTRALEERDVEPVLELLRAALGEPPLLRRTPDLIAWKHFEANTTYGVVPITEGPMSVYVQRALGAYQASKGSIVWERAIGQNYNEVLRTQEQQAKDQQAVEGVLQQMPERRQAAESYQNLLGISGLVPETPRR